MKHSIAATAALVVALLLGLSLVAYAQDPQPAATGTLTAQGDGYLGLNCQGSVEIQGQGSGIIWVGQGTVAAEGTGERFDIPSRGTLLVSWNGKVTVSGDKVGLRMISHKVQFTATGRGVARLFGSGTYTTESSSGQWSATGAKVPFGVRLPVEGQGTLTASGSGQADARGDLRVVVQGRGQGVIRIKGATTLNVEGQAAANGLGGNAAGGQRRDLDDGTVVLRNWSGRIMAEGAQLELAIRSTQVDLTVEGTGVVGLKGQGTYKIGNQEGNWTPEGLRIKVTP